MKDQRMKWDAKAAFKSLNAQGKRRQASIDDERLKTTPYTPPPNVAAWLKAQADKPKAGRDIGSLMRYHAAHKKGRTDDDCLREKFGASSARSPEASEVGGLTKTPTHAPPPPQSADGGQPLPSASTKPHGKDVDTPWPKCIHHRERGGEFLDVYESDGNGKQYHPSGVIFTCSQTYSGRIGTIPYGTAVANGKAAQWLEAHGHKDAAAQLRVTPRDDVATGGGRVWMNRAPRHFTETCYEHWRAVLIDGKVCTRGAWNKPGVWSGEANDVPSLQELESGSYPELFGTERDAILAECRKALGL